MDRSCTITLKETDVHVLSLGKKITSHHLTPNHYNIMSYLTPNHYNITSYLTPNHLNVTSITRYDYVI